jgi:hypothetical protein
MKSQGCGKYVTYTVSRRSISSKVTQGWLSLKAETQSRNSLDLVQAFKVWYYRLAFICLFMVNTKRMIKYITKIGQKTGILNASINVQIKAIIMARVLPYLAKKTRLLV